MPQPSKSGQGGLRWFPTGWFYRVDLLEGRAQQARTAVASATPFQRSPTLRQLQNSFAAADALAHGQ